MTRTCEIEVGPKRIEDQEGSPMEDRSSEDHMENSSSDDHRRNSSSGDPRENSEADAESESCQKVTKRKGYLSWDDYFMSVAFLSAQRSKDPNRQVGACIVGEGKVIHGIGYNGFPRGVSDDELPWAKTAEDGDPLKTKYPYVCHAELNAILNRINAASGGQRMYVTMFPCNECAKLIIQAGIREVVYFTEKAGGESVDGRELQPKDLAYVAARRLFSMAGVKVWQHKMAMERLVIEFR